MGIGGLSGMELCACRYMPGKPFILRKAVLENEMYID